MSNNVERRTFEKGMNWDVDESRLQPGEYRYALNILNGSTRNGALGVITNIKGNSKADASFNIPTSVQGARVVGAFDDHKKNRVFFLLASVNNRPAIYYYDIIKDEVVTVLEWSDTPGKVIDTSVLGLNVDNVIPETNIDIIYREQGDLLCWTDGKTEPKKINIDQAVRTTSDKFIGNGNPNPGQVEPLNKGDIFYIDVSEMIEGGNSGKNLDVPEGELVYYFEVIDDSASPFLEDDYDNTTNTQGGNFPIKLSGIVGLPNYKVSINFINKDKFRLIRGGEVYPLPLELESITQMPKAPPEEQKCRYGTMPSRDTNFLKNKLWQFRYKFVYDDDQESHWSPISEVPINSETIFDSLPGQTSLRPNHFDNVIQTFNYAKINSRIVSIKFAVRNGGSDNSKGDWQLVDEYPLRESGRTFLVRNDNSDEDVTVSQGKIGSMSVTFTNSKTLTPIDITDVTQLFYNVPKRSKSQSLTEENRLVHANITEGYNTDLSTIRDNPGSLSASPLELEHPLNEPEEELGVSINFTNKGLAPSGNIYDSFKIEILDPNQEIKQGDLFQISIKWWSAFRDRRGNENTLAYDIKDYRFYPRQVFVSREDGTGHDAESFNPTWVDAFGAPASNVFNYNPLELSGDKIRVIVSTSDVEEAENTSTPLAHIVAKKIADRINEFDTYIGGTDYKTHAWIDPLTLVDIGDGLGEVRRSNWKLNNAFVRGTNTQGGDFDFFQNAIAGGDYTPNSQRWYHAVEASHSGNEVVIDPKTHIVSKNDCVGTRTINNIYDSRAPSASGFSVNSFEFKTFYELDEEPVFVPRERLLGRDGISQKSSKRGAPQQYGIAFSDTFGRMSNVITTDAMGYTTKFSAGNNRGTSWDENRISSGAVATEINLPQSIIPDWATHYHVLRVNNKPKRRFIQLCTSAASTSSDSERNIFDLEDFSQDTASDAVKIYLDVLNGNGDRSITNLFKDRTILSYQYMKGDRVRFLYKIDTSDTDISTTPVNYYTSDVEILSFNPEDNSILIPREGLEASLQNIFVLANINNASVAAGILFEIYSTNPESGQEDEEESQLYYEIARTHPIITLASNQKRFGISRTPVSIQSGTYLESITSSSTTLIIKEGDVYFRPRIFNTDGDNLRIAWVEDENYSDFYVSDFTNIGRPNLPYRIKSTRFIKSGKIKEVDRISTMVWSEPLVAETNVNQIGTIFDTSVKDFNRIHGGINALVTKDFRVKIFFDDRVGWVMLGRQIFDDLNQQNLIGTSTGTVSEIQYYAGQYGCVAPRSIEEQGNRIYFADPKRGAVCQLAENGIVEINNGMDTLFKKLFQEQYRSEIGVSTLAAFDKNNDMYVLNIKSATELVAISEFDVTQISSDPETYEISAPFGTDFLEFPDIYYIGATIDFTGLFTETPDQFVIEDIASNKLTVITQPGSEITLGLELPFYNTTTLGYSTNLNKWASFYSYSPDYMVNAGLGMITFRSGLPYLHETNSKFAQYYGLDNKTQIQVVSNADSSFKKVWKALMLNSPTKGAWTADERPDDTIMTDYDTERRIEPVETNVESDIPNPEDNNYMLPYQTKILKEDFVYDEGTSWAAFNKNINQQDLSVPESIQVLTNAFKLGEQDMRGIWLKVLLTISPEVGDDRRIKLSDVIFRYMYSDYNATPDKQ